MAPVALTVKPHSTAGPGLELPLGTLSRPAESHLHGLTASHAQQEGPGSQQSAAPGVQGRRLTRQLSGPRDLRGRSFMAARVPSTVATDPMQKASSRRPVSLMMRLPCSARVRPARDLCTAWCCCMTDKSGCQACAGFVPHGSVAAQSLDACKGSYPPR